MSFSILRPPNENNIYIGYFTLVSTMFIFLFGFNLSLDNIVFQAFYISIITSPLILANIHEFVIFRLVYRGNNSPPSVSEHPAPLPNRPVDEQLKDIFKLNWDGLIEIDSEVKSFRKSFYKNTYRKKLNMIKTVSSYNKRFVEIVSFSLLSVGLFFILLRIWLEPFSKSYQFLNFNISYQFLPLVIQLGLSFFIALNLILIIIKLKEIKRDYTPRTNRSLICYSLMNDATFIIDDKNNNQEKISSTLKSYENALLIEDWEKEFSIFKILRNEVYENSSFILSYLESNYQYHLDSRKFPDLQNRLRAFKRKGLHHFIIDNNLFEEYSNKVIFHNPLKIGDVYHDIIRYNKILIQLLYDSDYYNNFLNDNMNFKQQVSNAFSKLGFRE